jgi:hypothetical protein
MPIKILVVLAILALPLVPTFWAIQDIPKRRFDPPKRKLMWLLFVSSLPFFGAMFYIIIGRRNTQPLEIPK